MAGDVQFDDVNKDGIIDERDKQVLETHIRNFMGN